MAESERDQNKKLQLPVIPIREMTLFPEMVTPVLVGRRPSKAALEEVGEDGPILLVAQKDSQGPPVPENMFEFGTTAVIQQIIRLPDGSLRILVEGQKRARVTGWVQTEPYLIAELEEIEEPELPEELPRELSALMRTVIQQVQQMSELGGQVHPDLVVAAMNIEEPGKLADLIASQLISKLEDRQEILERVDYAGRLERVSVALSEELEVLKLRSQVQHRLQEQMQKGQREMLLREQLAAIQRELGIMDERSEEIEELRRQIEAAGMPEEVKKKAEKELDRYRRLNPASAETGVIRTYLDWMTSLPWSKSTEDRLDLEEAQKLLDADHYGLEEVKDRILEHLAVRKLARKERSSILCFVGPPGTGKTSIGRAIADALGRRFARISLGGIRDEAEIRGHRRTYVGAMPGRIIQAINNAGTRNPVLMLDEIDKVGADFRGDPSSALLEALDPEQNHAFSDHYLEVPFDLSDVLFIATANVLETIPPALRDRMEVIRYSGYTEDEKTEIALRHLIPKQIEAHGLPEGSLKITEDAIRRILRRYTREAGVRNLERTIATLCRKVARRIVDSGDGGVSVTITGDDLEEYLGPPRFRYGVTEEKDEIGVATGLAWTQVGGDILFIEATTMPGKGSLTLTGQLGQVMKESAQAAMSYCRANARQLGIEPEDISRQDVHIHVPEGAVPKDGPSAGLAMTVALISALTGRPAKRQVAMTGEITLRGRVLPVGGIKEKVLAAHRAGVRTVILPEENRKDLVKIPENVRDELEFVFAERISDATKVALGRRRRKKPSRPEKEPAGTAL
ncbi:endopeptidase La [Rubrobacter taiwanensis]|jgi:ATP-dependent Lon protease|uniref:Lon protease n=1 Tax=Rubrobacter taiwanensis TaxID=185139 RepID=A0A4R1BGD8_9ACTN|nr:endopeptidase La [Rubrobacter taiwanensis]TCJ16138.1 endopeptidase La [Rubrobacter taiwanensis]